jgi:hypothetical protein
MNEFQRTYLICSRCNFSYGFAIHILYYNSIDMEDIPLGRYNI